MCKKYAKYKNGDDIWEVSYDADEYNYDIMIDDIQGDIMICGVCYDDLEFVSKDDYDKRIFDLYKYLMNNETV